jgi:hypothetical protein
MNAAKLITKAYFFGAMGVSAIHTIHSFQKMNLHTGEEFITPLGIDGLAFFGLALQSSKWSDSTNKIGLRIQIGAGIAQLAANVFAASSIGGMVFGLMIVGIYLLMEAIGPKLRTRAEVEAENAALAAAAAEKAEAEAAAAAREAKNAAARARRQAAKTAKHSAERAENRRIREVEKALTGSK